MNYIIVDLEWNQSPQGKGSEREKLPFEIIEVGAVKVSSQRKILDEFHSYIRPQVYSEFHYKTQELLNIDIKDLKNQKYFSEVSKEFFNWCGDEYVFCTWGNMDLTELQRNLAYYHLLPLLLGPIRYYDVQKLFALQYEGVKNPHTLEYAVDFLQIRKKEFFHSAIHDARYTAEVFVRLWEETLRSFSIDCYQNPKNKEEEIYIKYDLYSKYISREFKTKEDAIQDKDVVSTVCYLCGKRAAKRVKWFSSNTKNYYCLALCRKHGYLKGKLRLKKTDGDKVYAIKILKLVDEAEAAAIQLKQKEIKRRKKEKRDKKATN